MPNADVSEEPLPLYATFQTLRQNYEAAHASDTSRICSYKHCHQTIPPTHEYKWKLCPLHRAQGREAQKRKREAPPPPPPRFHPPRDSVRPPPKSPPRRRLTPGRGTSDASRSADKENTIPGHTDSAPARATDSESEAERPNTKRKKTFSPVVHQPYEDARTLLYSLGLRCRKFEHVEFTGKYTMADDPLCSPRERVRLTANEICDVTKWRFTVKDHTKLANGHATRFWCSQDAERQKDSKKSEKPDVKHRDTLGMDRFSCEGYLRVAVKLCDGQQVITVSFRHHHNHVKYFSVDMPPEALQIIRDNLHFATPNSLVTHVQAKFPRVTAGQVHTAWATMSESLWKRSPNQLESGEALLKEFEALGKVDRFEGMKVDPGVTILGWGLPGIAERVTKQVVEVAMDATYNTNTKDLELYCIMGEVQGVGIPLAYCLLSTATSLTNGKRITALNEFLRCVKEKYNLNPRFILTDKDIAEITAVQRQWPFAKHQLCWWHLRKAIRERLAKAKLSTVPYKGRVARAAHAEFAFIDLAFTPGGAPDPKEAEDEELVKKDQQQPEAKPTVRGPNTLTFKIPALSQLRASALSSVGQSSSTTEAVTTFDEADNISEEASPSPNDTDNADAETGGANNDDGDADDDEDEVLTPESAGRRRVFCPELLREDIVALVEQHLCAHPLIPGYSAPTKAGIREWAVKALYLFCVKHDLREVWAYMWGCWYRPERWKLWARCECEDMIPRLKTTMICESHWRRIKKDFLHHFHKPRIDLLVWILTEKLLPTYSRKLDVLLIPNGRHRELPAWRKAFKKEWRRCEKECITDAERTALRYAPKPALWVCACPAMVRSRFLICKHLVQACYQVKPRFFIECSRSRSLPFWSHPLLVPLTEDRPDPTATAVPAQPQPFDDHHISTAPGGQDSDADDNAEDELASSNSDSDDSDEEEEEMAGAVLDESSSLIFDVEIRAIQQQLQWFQRALEHNTQFRDERFLRTVKQRGNGLFRLIEDLQDIQRRTDSTIGPNPNTWGARSSSFMFFRTIPKPADVGT